MPETLFAPFAETFERENPGVTVNVLNKNTNAGIEEIVRGNPRGFDIFWVSSAEAFTVLNAHEAFLTDNTESGKRVAYYPFALSSIGWAFRRDSPGPPPAEWDDLLRPEYSGKIAMTRPSRSGTTHMFVERFLQVRGWDGGWRYLLALTGNLSTLTSRSFGVVDGVEKHRFDIGISIDFLARSRAEQGVSFTYGQPIMVMPAQIGILRGGQSPDLAAAFIALVLSPKGQEMLLGPNIRRVPIDPVVRLRAGPAAQGIETALRLNWLAYDALLARDRYWAVNALFDLFVTFQLAERRVAWQRVRALGSETDPAIQAGIAEVERLLTNLPVSEKEALGSGVNDVPTRITALSRPTPLQQARLERWRMVAAERMERVFLLLDQLERAAGTSQ